MRLEKEERDRGQAEHVRPGSHGKKFPFYSKRNEKSLEVILSRGVILCDLNFFFFFVFLGPHPRHMEVPG